jgi:hypothetical protein
MPDNIFSQIEAGLIARGFTLDQARGISAGIYAESGSNPIAVNPSSGAFGLGQWLGARKTGVKALAAQRGEITPSFKTQLDYLAYELKGGDAGGASVLRAQGQGNILTAYITKFMRPAAGKETTGDLERGATYLAGNTNAGPGRVFLKGLLGDWAGNLLSDGYVAEGTLLAAPGDKLFGGLSLGDWFTRITFGVFAILLIAVALFMLSGKSVADVATKVPPIPV